MMCFVSIAAAVTSMEMPATVTSAKRPAAVISAKMPAGLSFPAFLGFENDGFAGIDERRVFGGLLPSNGRLLPLLNTLVVLALEHLGLHGFALPLFSFSLPFDGLIFPLFGCSEFFLGLVSSPHRDSARLDRVLN